MLHTEERDVLVAKARAEAAFAQARARSETVTPMQAIFWVTVVVLGMVCLVIVMSMVSVTPKKPPLTAAQQQKNNLIATCASGLQILDSMRKRLVRPISDGGILEYFAIFEFDGGRYAEQFAHPKSDAALEANFQLARSIGDGISGRGPLMNAT
jgi:hypothetical protein